jgi:hypothetical protein
MSRYPDPWLPSPKWEPYELPQDEKFDTVDRKTYDLGTFLRSEEVQQFLGQTPRVKEEVQGSVRLPDSTPAQLTQRADGSWELSVHLKRDYYKIFIARTRDEVLRLAIGDGHVRHA